MSETGFRWVKLSFPTQHAISTELDIVQSRYITAFVLPNTRAFYNAKSANYSRGEVWWCAGVAG